MYRLLVELVKPKRVIRVLIILLLMYAFLPCASKTSLHCVFYVIMTYGFFSVFTLLALSSLFKKVLKTKGIQRKFEDSFPPDEMYYEFKFLVEMPEHEVKKILSDLDLDCMFPLIMWIRSRYYDVFLTFVIVWIVIAVYSLL